MGEEVVRAAARRLEQALVAGLGEVHREAVDAPRLPARPARVVERALLGRTAQRLAGVGIPVEGVEGRVVLAQDVLAQLRGCRRTASAKRSSPVCSPAHVSSGMFMRLSMMVRPALSGVGQIAPRLDDAGRLEEPAHQVVGREQRRRACVLVAEQPPGRDGRQRVEEAEIVGLEVLLRAHPPLEVGRVDERGIPERVVAGELPREPELTRAEAGRPAAVAAEPDAARRRAQQIAVRGRSCRRGSARRRSRCCGGSSTAQRRWPCRSRSC